MTDAYVQHQLFVFYDIEKDVAGKFVFRDEEAWAAAGIESHSSGCSWGIRDLQFGFDSRDELQAAMRRLRDAGFRVSLLFRDPETIWPPAGGWPDTTCCPPSAPTCSAVLTGPRRRPRRTGRQSTRPAPTPNAAT